MKPSLFDQLYNKLDMDSITPAQRTPTVAEAAAENGQSQAPPKDIFGMKFTHSLIKHLDMLYSKMIAGENPELASEPDYNPKQKIIEGATDSIMLNEKESFYNPGNSNVTESF